MLLHKRTDADCFALFLARTEIGPPTVQDLNDIRIYSCMNGEEAEERKNELSK